MSQDSRSWLRGVTQFTASGGRAAAIPEVEINRLHAIFQCVHGHPPVSLRVQVFVRTPHPRPPGSQFDRP